MNYDKAVTNKKQKIEKNRSDLQLFHNEIKKQLINKFVKNKEIVFDFASGRGGDLPKFLHADIDKLFLFDQSSESTIDSKERYDLYYKFLAKKTLVFFQVQDLSKPFIDEISEKASVISCMFALHYFLETKDICNQFFKNVSSNLVDNGVFFGCVPSGKKILQLLNHTNEFSNSIVKIEVGFEKKECFGSSYKFKLQNSILSEFESKEYLVFENVIVAIAAKNGLIPILDLGLIEGLETQKTTLFKYFQPEMQSKDEIEVSSLFAAFAFRKAIKTK